MRILYHHRIRSKDGQYVHMVELTQALSEKGNELIVVGPRVVETEQFGAEAGWTALLKKWLPSAVYEVLELGYSVLDYLRLIHAVRRHHPDCIYERYNLFLPSGIWAKNRFQLPLVLEVNAPLYEERRRYGGVSLRRLASWSERFTWRNADYVVPVTAVLGQEVLKAGAVPERVVVIPNGIDPRRFEGVPDRAEAKKALRLDGQVVLGFVGFIREWHGLDRVMQVLVEEREINWHLLLVGDGPARNKLQRHSVDLGISNRVTITGVVDRKRVLDYLAAFDIALQPHVVPYASPLKLFEYLALGHPTIAPASENIREVLEHEANALLFEPGNMKEFSDAVRRLCLDADLRSRLGREARKTIVARGLTWERNAQRVIDLFQNAGVTVGIDNE